MQRNCGPAINRANMSNSRFFIIVSGPTAVGKTAALPEFTSRIKCEIINADVGQLYEPLSIGTAKPAWQKEAVPHHLFDVMTTPDNFSVAAYREKVFTLMEEIWTRGNVPLLVGGSLFYLRSLFYPPPLTGESNEEAQGHDALSSQALWAMLNAVDPARAARIVPADRYRLRRALNLWEKTGVKPSDQRPLFVSPPAPYAFIFLSRERDDLTKRINDRVLEMMSLGWVDEVRKLSPAWHSFLRKKKLIGYPEIVCYLQNCDQGELVDESLLIKVIQQKTRQYAKRQMTFWRMLKRELSPHKEGVIFEINLTLCDLALYIEHVFLCMQPFFAVSGGESNE